MSKGTTKKSEAKAKAKGTAAAKSKSSAKAKSAPKASAKSKSPAKSMSPAKSKSPATSMSPAKSKAAAKSKPTSRAAATSKSAASSKPTSKAGAKFKAAAKSKAAATSKPTSKAGARSKAATSNAAAKPASKPATPAPKASAKATAKSAATSKAAAKPAAKPASTPAPKAPSAKATAKSAAARPSLSLGKTTIDGVAARSYQLRAHVHGDLVSDKIELYTGPTAIMGDLLLDFDGDDEDAADGIIVDGDLNVVGSIVNRNSDHGPFLLVTGNVRAANLIAAGSEIVVLGDLVVEGTVFGFYNHGSITVHGKTRAHAIITEYHSFDLRGPVEGISVSGRGSITNSDTYSSYAPALVPEILTEGNPPGGYPDWERTADAILAGRPVLRDDVID